MPVLVQLGSWGRRFLPASRELSIRAQVLEEGGPQLWEDFMQELRMLHLGAEPAEGAVSVMERLEQAYRDALAAPSG